MKTKTKLKLVILATIIGTQFTLPRFAADAQAANSTDAEEIAALKKEIQALEEKADRLDDQQKSQAQPSAQIEALDQISAVLSVNANLIRTRRQRR